MVLKLKTLFARNVPIKLISGIIAYGLWYILGPMCQTTRLLPVQLYFYNTPEQALLVGPETVTVMLHGPRDQLSTLNQSNIAAHVDASMFHPNKEYILQIDEKKLFLPDDIKLISCCPSPVIVHSHQIESPIPA